MVPDDKKAEFEELKTMIRSFVLPHQDGVFPSHLNNDYKDLEGRDIPYAEFGFRDLLHLLNSITDTVQFKMSKDGSRRLFAIATQETVHIQQMVAEQRPKAAKKSKKAHYLNKYQRNNFRLMPSATGTSRTCETRSYAQSTLFLMPGLFSARRNLRPAHHNAPQRSSNSQLVVKRAEHYRGLANRPPPPPHQHRYTAPPNRLHLPLATPAIGAGAQLPPTSSLHYQRPSASETFVPLHAQEELKVFLERYKPDGIPLEHFDTLFRHETKRQFIPQNFGFKTSEAALKSIPQVITLVPKSDTMYVKLTDWMPVAERPQTPRQPSVPASSSSTTSSPRSKTAPDRERMGAAISDVGSAPAAQPAVNSRDPRLRSVMMVNSRSPRPESAMSTTQNGVPADQRTQCTDLTPVPVTPVQTAVEKDEFVGELTLDCDEKATFTNLLLSAPHRGVLPISVLFTKFKENFGTIPLARWGVGSWLEAAQALPSLLIVTPPAKSNQKLYLTADDEQLVYLRGEAPPEVIAAARIVPKEVGTGTHSSNVTGQLSHVKRMLMIKSLFNCQPIATAEFGDRYYLDFHMQLSPEAYGYENWRALIEAQIDFPVEVKIDGKTGKEIMSISAPKYMRWARLQCGMGHEAQIAALAEDIPENAVRPNERYQILQLQDDYISDLKSSAKWKTVVISAVSSPRAFWIYLAKHKHR